MNTSGLILIKKQLDNRSYKTQMLEPRLRDGKSFISVPRSPRNKSQDLNLGMSDSKGQVLFPIPRGPQSTHILSLLFNLLRGSGKLLAFLIWCFSDLNVIRTPGVGVSW